jgi:hypothetical protein
VDDEDEPPEEPVGSAPEQRISTRNSWAPGNPYAFKPGQSGNPLGRPKGWRTLFREHAEGIAPGDAEGRTRLRFLMDALFLEAIPRKDTRQIIDADGKPRTVSYLRRGNVSAAREYLDRADGRVPIAIQPVFEDDPESIAGVQLVTVGDEGDELQLAAAKPGANGRGNGGPPKSEIPE